MLQALHLSKTCSALLTLTELSLLCQQGDRTKCLHASSTVVHDTDPLMWWKQHQQEFPRLARMARQYLAVPSSSASSETLFSSVGFEKSDLRGSGLDTTLRVTLINVIWAEQAP
jgi:hypothetical protein